MDTVKVINVIHCTTKRRGQGVEHSPIRVVTEVFDLKGNLIAENDPYTFNTENLLSFLQYRYKEKTLEQHMENICQYFIELDD